MKSKKLIKSLAAVLVLAMLVAAFAACTKDPGKKDDPNKSGTTGGEEKPSYTTPLVVAYDNFSQKFSPFFASTSYDQDVAGMTQLGTMMTTRSSAIVYKGIEGEDEMYNGTNYHYEGTSDIDVAKQADGSTVYTIKMRDDIKFSDGTPATIDDVIFYYYVILDPYYTGSSTMSSIDIKGLKAYQYNNSAIADFDAAAWLAANEATNVEFQNYVMENLVKRDLMSDLEYVQQNYTVDSKPAYMTNASGAKDVLYVFYGLEHSDWIGTETITGADGTEQTVYTYADELKALTEQQVIDMILAEYNFQSTQTVAGEDGTNYTGYKAFGINYGGDPEYYAAEVANAAMLIGANAEGTSNEVPNVEGIKKIDQYTVQVTTNSYEANAIYQICSATIAPMHYYGDKSLYNYEQNQFGFHNRAEDSMALIETKTANPMGAGPYKFVKYEDKVVYFEANENYYKGEPYIKNIQFKETISGDKVAAISTGDVDAASDVTGSVKMFQEIAGYNKDTNDITGDTVTSSLVWNLGYGYIGINADIVKVGEPGSEASKNLRKAYATIFAVHREANIASYYDTCAAVIEYPISSTSWAAPQTSDQGYRIAYSQDVTGADLYTSTMTADQKYAAALQAAIGFFKAAGFQWDEAQQKFTAGPNGADLTKRASEGGYAFEAIVPGGGSGDHPAFQILEQSRADLEKIGITLIINDPVDSNALWDSFDAATNEIWAAAWGSTIDPDMYQVYHSDNIVGKPGATGSNNYHMQDPTLDALILEARQSDDQTFRKETYKECLDILLDWGVEIPAYQRKNLVCFSTQRIKIDTLTPDITTYWGWMSEIETLELNK